MPGAGGFIAYQWLSKAAKPDGLTVGCFGGTLPLGEATGDLPQGALSLREANIIALLGDVDVCYGRKAMFPQGYKSLLSPTKRPFVVGHPRRDDGYVVGMATMTLLGLKKGPKEDYTQVYGYPGTNDGHLALMRSEVDVWTTRVAGYREAPLREVKAGNLVPLFQGGFITGTGQLVRDAGVKEIPTKEEVVRELTGKDASGSYYDYVL